MASRSPGDGSADGPDDLPRDGLIFPRVPALLRRIGDDGLEIANLATYQTVRLHGRFAEEVERFFLTGRLGAMTQSLPASHELRVLLDTLQRSTRLALTPTTALQLEGLDTLFVELTGACTERCAHCYAEANDTVDSALSQATCEAVIRDAASLGVRRLQLTGGEPLLCAFLPDLVALASELGLPSCEIFTNGMLLDDDLLARLAPFRPAFAFSFYSHEPAVHDGITRTPGSHGLTRAAIERCVAQQLETRVAIIVMEENASQVADTLAYVRALGVELATASASYSVGRGGLYSGGFSTGEPASPDVGKCGDQQGKLCVAHDGTVYPCIFNRSTPLGSLRDRSLAEILACPQLPTADDRNDEDFIRTTNEQLACVECRLTALALRALSRSG